MIHSSGYVPSNFRFLGESKDGPFLGIELELELSESLYGVDCDEDIDCKESLDDYASDILHSGFKNLGWIKEDGSLDYGFELCSFPTTLTQARMQWPNMLRYLRNYSLEDTSEAGLHVHIDRANLPVQAARRLIRWLNRDTETGAGMLTIIGGRAPNQWWSLVNLHRNSPKPRIARSSSHGGRYHETGKSKYYFNGYERYRACAWTNPHTLELRFPQSTVDSRQFFAVLEFAEAAFYYAQADNNLRWWRFLEWLEPQAKRWPALVGLLRAENRMRSTALNLRKHNQKTRTA